MEAKSALRIAIVVSCLGVTALGYRNSNGDNSDAVALASKAACPNEDCIAVLGRVFFPSARRQRVGQLGSAVDRRVQARARVRRRLAVQAQVSSASA
jgi:hypothetical protein